MGHNILIVHKQRERAALLRLARDIVVAGDRRGRPLSPGEDAMVVEFGKAGSGARTRDRPFAKGSAASDFFKTP